MSYLIATNYHEVSDASAVRDSLLALQRENLLVVRDAVVATREGDQVKLDQLYDLVAGGTLSGAFWGTLVGLIFGVPVFGLGAGMLTGALGGAFSDVGIDDGFAEQVTEHTPEGTATLLILIDTDAIDKVVTALRRPTVRLVHTNVDLSTEQRIGDLLSA